MADKIEYPPVVFTDDGWALMSLNPPLTAQDLKENVVDGYTGTGGALWWSLGDHEVYHYETEVGEVCGAGYAELDESPYSFVHSTSPGMMARLRDNTQSLIATGRGPLTTLMNLCADSDLPFLPRFRMNSHYVIDPAHPGYGRWRREHPDLLIGRLGEEISKNSTNWGIRTGKDFSCHGVREYVASIIFELIDRFDVEGVELDFMRHPAFFRIEEAFQHRYLMTDLIRKIRQRLDEAGTSRGKRLILATRVPPTIADSTRIGLDVAAWIKERLVDIVVVGGGNISFETSTREFVEAARTTSCLIYGCISSRLVDPKCLRALAARWYSDGADGIYLYNFYTQTPEWNKRTFDELSNARGSKHLSKCYELASIGGFYPTDGHGAAFRYGHSSTQLPITLKPNFAGRGPILHIEISDNIESVGTEGTLKSCSCNLALRFDNLTDKDELVVYLNNISLPWASAHVSFDGWMRMAVEPLYWTKYPTYPVEQHQEGISVEFELDCPPLCNGKNELNIRLISNHTDRTEPVILKGIELSITYQDEDTNCSAMA